MSDLHDSGADEEPSVGSTVAKRYRLTEPLGRGRYGSVYRAQDLELSRDVAIKFFLPEGSDASRADLVRRFEEEARTHASLEHHGIVVIHDVRMDHQPPFLVLELVVGRNLMQTVEQHGRLSASEVQWVLRAVQEPLDYMHANRVLHLDLKPSNLVVQGVLGERGSTVKILDFGLAVPMPEPAGGDAGPKATPRGTLEYAAPEVLLGKQLTRKADVYGLAATLFCLLTGAPPPNPVLAARGLADAEEPPPPSLELSDDPLLAQAVVAALSFDPAKRPGSVGRLVAAAAAPPFEMPLLQPRLWTWRQGIQAIAALALLALLGWGLRFAFKDDSTTRFELPKEGQYVSREVDVLVIQDPAIDIEFWVAERAGEGQSGNNVKLRHTGETAFQGRLTLSEGDGQKRLVLMNELDVIAGRSVILDTKPPIVTPRIASRVQADKPVELNLISNEELVTARFEGAPLPLTEVGAGAQRDVPRRYVADLTRIVLERWSAREPGISTVALGLAVEVADRASNTATVLASFELHQQPDDRSRPALVVEWPAGPVASPLIVRGRVQGLAGLGIKTPIVVVTLQFRGTNRSTTVPQPLDKDGAFRVEIDIESGATLDAVVELQGGRLPPERGVVEIR